MVSLSAYHDSHDISLYQSVQAPMIMEVTDAMQMGVSVCANGTLDLMETAIKLLMMDIISTVMWVSTIVL